MNRRNFIAAGLSGFFAGAILVPTAFANKPTKKSDSMKLKQLALPSPKALRGGWAALAAVCAARGWKRDVYAEASQWLYHDGGGNWACLRFLAKNQVVLVGHDHEYSETYFREAAQYFEEEQTDLLAGAPDWWGKDLNPKPFGEWIGFVYGWDGAQWQRSGYEKEDGFESLGLLDACSIRDIELLTQFAADAPGLKGSQPSPEALQALVLADANITPAMLEDAVPGWDIGAGVLAAQAFLKANVE